MYIGEYKVLDIEYDELMGLASHYKSTYSSNSPFPNIYFDDFFNDAFLTEVLSEFPEMGGKEDIQYKTPNEVKLASRGESRFGKATKVFMHFLNSEPFLNFLSELTGIEDLLGDPYYEGGGCHQIKRGGFLKVHAEFNKHKRTGLDRRLNVLVYLNKDWKEEYGGHFELWNEGYPVNSMGDYPKVDYISNYNCVEGISIQLFLGCDFGENDSIFIKTKGTESPIELMKAILNNIEG